MAFLDLLKKIKGLHVRFNNGGGRVIEVYWDRHEALVRLDEGTSYVTHNDVFGMHFISDGTDTIVIPIERLEAENPTWHSD